MSNDEKLKAVRNGVAALSVSETAEAPRRALETGMDPHDIIKKIGICF
jgi:methanogenic corrinoid protein MtbC1